MLDLYNIRLDFLLASMIGKPVEYHAQSYHKGEPRSGWVLIGCETIEGAKERIASWSEWLRRRHKPQGFAKNNWSPSTDLNHMIEVEEFIAKNGWQKEYLLALDDEEGTNGEFELLTTPAIKRAEAALKVIKYYIGEEYEKINSLS